jgi:signal transduction histidine kinase
MIDPAFRDALDVARGILDDLDVEVVLGRVLDSARTLTSARYAALGVLDESRSELARFVSAGIDDSTRREIGSLPRGRGVLGELIDHPVPLRLADVGAHPHSYGFPTGHPPMKSFLGVPVFVAGEPFGNLYLTDKQDAAEFSDDDEEALVLLAELAGLAIDHAQRYTGSEAGRDELERTVQALDATIQIADAVGGETNLDAVLELVAMRGRALVSARALVIELQSDDELLVAAGAGEIPPGLVGQRVRLEGTVASTALRSGRSQRLDDRLNRARFEQHGLRQLGLRAEGGLVVPLVFHSQPQGALVAVDRLRGGPSFTAQDQRLLESCAVSAATAVATARSVAAERRSQRLAVAEQERGRWARELHDETLQALASLRVGLAVAERSGDTETLAGAVREAIEQLDAEMTGLRGLIAELRPVALERLGLEAAIDELAERATRTGLVVDVNVDLTQESGRRRAQQPAELVTAIFRIVQEALTNANKHGRARRATIKLVERENSVRIAVHDDGQGFDPASKRAGFGLLGMRERADLLGGKLQIRSAPGEGTTVMATFPALSRAVDPAPTPIV